MLALGLGEMTNESLTKLADKDEPEYEIFKPVAVGNEGVAGDDMLQKISMADELENRTVLHGVRQEAHWSTEEDRIESESGGDGGGSGAMLLVVGAAILFAVYV